jgi:hypothetical protein
MTHASSAASAITRVPIHVGALLGLANDKVGRGVDADMVGNRITDCDVLLRGAYGPAVIRLVNLAANLNTAPISRQRMLELAKEAFAAVVDLDLRGNVITEYKVVLTEPYGFGPTVLNLVNLAIEHQAILRKTATNPL